MSTSWTDSILMYYAPIIGPRAELDLTLLMSWIGCIMMTGHVERVWDDGQDPAI